MNETQAIYMRTPDVATSGQQLPDGRATAGQRRCKTVDKYCDCVATLARRFTRK